MWYNKENELRGRPMEKDKQVVNAYLESEIQKIDEILAENYIDVLEEDKQELLERKKFLQKLLEKVSKNP